MATDFPRFLDVVWDKHEPGEVPPFRPRVRDGGGTEDEALKAARFDAKQGWATEPRAHAVYLNTGAIAGLTEPELMDLIHTSPLLHAVYTLGRHHEAQVERERSFSRERG